ncbi:hypothetical protein SPRG_15415 [Saprolegnia parasitica CBS 223.65]|uniref:Uncharacterized protein n=1 Tax=Saprolegnia parasitica (strain CBS 223.65) TaxID=695850 RepID=A0A067BRJ7_SAPPC|nr:hypothetical protein SPRG_15415 [Saprolegnia parasitica CBS 223.65]KDO19425.1 hypothetical protein SPRG_15415 [Saprolegnia parasitica CBS 223.65]|eukprot:XP_012209851.1 hypothetical protein SPRG_15415 [Saprolegnia parasitica CBS 223.65]
MQKNVRELDTERRSRNTTEDNEAVVCDAGSSFVREARDRDCFALSAPYTALASPARRTSNERWSQRMAQRMAQEAKCPMKDLRRFNSRRLREAKHLVVCTDELLVTTTWRRNRRLGRRRGAR